MAIKARPAEEIRLLAEAESVGLIRRFATGETSNWDELPFRERRNVAYKNLKACAARRARIYGKEPTK